MTNALLLVVIALILNDRSVRAERRGCRSVEVFYETLAGLAVAFALGSLAYPFV